MIDIVRCQCQMSLVVENRGSLYRALLGGSGSVDGLAHSTMVNNRPTT